jgi:hypothetical protein
VCLGDTSIAATSGFMQLDAIVLGVVSIVF